MSRILFFALLAAGGWYFWKTWQRQTARVDASLRKAEARAARKPVNRQDTVALEKDPATGVYRPVDRAD